ncbi:MAG: hypothetical protein K6G18_17225 [Treponema sp.]|nr:hypothetical protein [Treponema sp.]
MIKLICLIHEVKDAVFFLDVDGGMNSYVKIVLTSTLMKSAAVFKYLVKCIFD